MPDISGTTGAPTTPPGPDAAGDDTQVPQCLVCSGRHPTTQRKGDPGIPVVARHGDPGVATDTPTPGHDCAGALMPPVTGDPMVDELRRRAIDEAARYGRKAAEARAEFGGALTDLGWTMHATLAFFGADVIRVETVAKLWRDLAVAGQWWPVVCTALENLRVAGDTAADLVTLASVEETRKGAQMWLREVRFDVIRDHRGGLTTDQLAALLGAL